MALDLGQYLEFTAAAQVVTSTGNKLTASPGQPMDFIRFGAIFTVAGGSGSLVLAIDKRVTAGSDTGRVEVATMTVTAAQATAGSVHTLDISPLEIDPGEEVILEVTTGLTSAGTAILFAHAQPRGFQAGRIDHVTKH